MKNNSMTEGKDIAFIFGEGSGKEFIQSIKTKKELLVVCGNDNIKRKFLDLGYSCKSTANIQTILQKISQKQ